MGIIVTDKKFEEKYIKFMKDQFMKSFLVHDLLDNIKKNPTSQPCYLQYGYKIDNATCLMNVYTHENKYYFDLIVPGYKKNDIKVSLKNNKIQIILHDIAFVDTIVWKRRDLNLDKGRTLTIDLEHYNIKNINFDLEKIDVTYTSGILSICIPCFNNVENYEKEFNVQ